MSNQIDRQIGLSGGWVAGPSAGLAMMAAPGYLQLHPLATAICFWTGVGLFSLSVAHMAWVHLRERGYRMSPPFLTMAIGVIIFLIGAAWTSWPKDNTAKIKLSNLTEQVDPDLLKVYVKCEDMFWVYLDGQISPESPINVYIIGKNDGVADDGIGVGHIRPNHYKEFREFQEKYYSPHSASLIKCTMKFYGSKAFYGVRATVPFDLYNAEKVGSINFKPTTLYRKDQFGLKIEDANNDKDVYTFIVFTTEMNKFVRLDFPTDVIYKELGSDQYKRALVTANFMDAPFIDFLGAIKL